MTKRSKLRLVVIGMTCLWALAEWFLLELRRAPYRPPYDMRTFLGTERVFVEAMMIALAVGWAVALCAVCVYSRFPLIDYLWFGLTIAILAALLAAVVVFPPWTVTPYELLWS